MKLYDAEIRLMLGLLQLRYERLPIDLFAKEQKSEAFLKINPKGEIPVLLDEENTVIDSNAFLVYLARKFDSERWLPTSALTQARIQHWLSTAANEIHHGVAAARAVKALSLPRNYEDAVQKALLQLHQLEQHLSQRLWLAADHATIADIAVYPYVALAEEGEVSLQPYTHINGWLARVEGLPGFVAAPRTVMRNNES